MQKVGKLKEDPSGQAKHLRASFISSIKVASEAHVSSFPGCLPRVIVDEGAARPGPGETTSCQLGQGTRSIVVYRTRFAGTGPDGKGHRGGCGQQEAHLLLTSKGEVLACGITQRAGAPRAR